MTPQQEAVATRRAEVARLTTDGLSQRAIAERLGISRDTVVRDQRTNQTTATAPVRTSQTTSQTTATAPVRTSQTGGADAGAHQPVTEVPLPSGDVLVVPLTTDLAEDLAVLVRTGRTPTTAIAEAVAHLAESHRVAWDYGDAPDGHELHPVSCGAYPAALRQWKRAL